MAGTRRPSPVVALTAVLVLVAGVLGVGLVEEPSVVLPLTLELLFLAGLTWFVVLRAGPDHGDREWLSKVLFAALALRLLLAVVLHFRFSPTLFAPDAEAYAYFGRTLADFWRGEASGPGSVYESWQSGYYVLNAVFFFVFGPSAMGPVVLNIFVALWTTVLAYRLATLLLNREVGRIAALLVAFFPSLVLWSVLNIRDAVSTFLVLLVTYAVVRLSRRVRAAHVLALGAGLFFMSTIREYMVVLLILGGALGVVASLRPGKVFQTIFVGAFLAFVAVLAAENLGFIERVSTSDPLSTVAQIREGMLREASSSFAQGLDPSTPRGALLALPVGLAYLLFAPFPWAVSSLLQTFTLPEVLLWYCLVPFTVYGVKRVVSGAPRDVVIPAGILVVVLCTYALVEGNIGTAYRHRAQIMPLLFLFTAAGIQAYLARRKERTEKRKRRVKEAWAARR